ncbi:hypothetical protein I79_013596 [Cricetulus griseus]|uniref:Uncharacterized protein n=1 Tax=Cricetulus griseus TaxID=10029 RepID=G3HRX2_CRIGR|nr:hypothetical protein I79_013596 [Cricetulus griseus]
MQHQDMLELTDSLGICQPSLPHLRHMVPVTVAVLTRYLEAMECPPLQKVSC